MCWPNLTNRQLLIKKRKEMKAIENHSELSDYTFEQAFLHSELPPSIFNHEAHLRLAWIHIRKYGLEQAEQNIHDQLLTFVKAIGATGKYNKTLTIVAVRAVHHFMQKSTADGFESFMLEFPQLKSGFKDLINSHYTFDIFNSERAKVDFIAPDLSPFN